MKRTSLFLMLLIALSIVVFFGCTSNPNQNIQVTVNSKESIGENLNLQALGELIKQCKTPQDIEQKLNADSSINNLDLDGDGKRDYLKVTEFGQGNEHGYSITDVQKDGEPEVATININVQTQTMQLNGNSQYYGNVNNSYQSSFSTTDFLLLTWMMQPHYTYYRSPYYYGYYGYGYRPIAIVPYHVYHSRPYVSSARTNTTYRTVTTHTTTIKSPNSSNTSKSVQNHVSVTNPSHSQKSFGERSSSKPIGSGGFNSKSSSPSKSYGGSSGSSSSKSYGGSSGKSWGGSSSHSSWGSSSHSSSGSHSSGGSRKSDIRTKDNILPLTFDINEMNNVDIVHCSYKPEWVAFDNLPSTPVYSYIAQNLEQTFPNAVTTDEYGYKTVDYFGMTAVNTEAIKTLITLVQNQQKEINELKRQLKNK